MYKVVIIDDEPIIVEGLTRVVPWGKYECEVVGSAMDGQEGLELIRKLKPDMVFSDIYMPKMDGLVLTAALKSEFDNLEISILTGYRDFDLLQKALHLGVTRYILKPSSMKELEEAVKTMTERLKKKGIFANQKIDTPDIELRTKTVNNSSEIMSSDNSEVISEDRTTQEQSNQAGSFLVKNAIDYIKENYHRKVTLKDVADHIYVSQWHLSKLLNKHTGKSFSEILNTTRINAAKELLKNPALRVSDVADEVGFLDIAHFSRVFKKITGMSANEYRNRHG